MNRPNVNPQRVVRHSHTIEYLPRLKTFKSKLAKQKEVLTSALKYRHRCSRHPMSALSMFYIHTICVSDLGRDWKEIMHVPGPEEPTISEGE